jgi:transmembrane sensor
VASELDPALLARYVAGEATAEQRSEVEVWAAEADDHRDELALVRQCFEDAAAMPSPSRVDAMWEKLATQVHTPSAPTSVHRSGAPVFTLHPSSARRFVHRWTTGIAAAIVVVAFGAGALYRITHRAVAPAASTQRVFSTTRGQRVTLHLADGTRVELGYESVLRVQPFSGGRREVTLVGEAKFDVVHDARRPFIVNAGNSITEDIGTSFAVTAYPRDRDVRVLVVSGRVSVRSGDATSPNGVVLDAGEAARVDGGGRLERIVHPSATSALGWLSDRLSFENERIDDVAVALERRFDLTIRVPDSSVAARRVTIVNARSADEVLQQLTAALGLHLRRADSVIFVER